MAEVKEGLGEPSERVPIEKTDKEDRLLAEIEELRKTVRRLEQRVETLSAPRPKAEDRIRTFIDNFDEVLEGGIPRGHVVLVSGPTGTMKSSLALSVLHNNRLKGLKGLYISLEESRESLVRTMTKLGFSTDEDFIVDIGRLRTEHEDAEEAKDWFQILSTYLSRRVERSPVNLLVIDPLNSLYSLAEIENPRKEIFHFFNFLRDLGVTAFIIAESELDEGAYSYHEDFVADGALALRFSTNASGKVELLLRCVKMRHTNHSRDYFRLKFESGRFLAEMTT